MTEKVQMCSSGQLGQILLDGLEEIIGLSGVNAVLDQARLYRLMGPSRTEFPKDIRLDNFIEMQSALEALYGVRGGQGTALRAGRVSFHCILREHGDEMGLNAPEFRFRPTAYKISMGLATLAEKFSGFCSENIRVFEDETAWIWEAVCQSPSSTSQLMTTCNHFILGMLQEFTQWAAGGKHYMLNQVRCGNLSEQSSQIRIEKRAMD